MAVTSTETNVSSITNAMFAVIGPIIALRGDTATGPALSIFGVWGGHLSIPAFRNPLVFPNSLHVNGSGSDRRNPVIPLEVL